MSEQGGYEAGWYPNPGGGPGLRWYDGVQWTDEFHFEQGSTGLYRGPGWGTGEPGSALAGHTVYSPPPAKSPWGYFVYVLTHFFDFGGRARRAEYWWYTLIATMISLAMLGAALFVDERLLVMVVVWSMLLIVPSLAAAVRRLHDTDKSGWWLLLQLLPLGGLVLIVFLALDGNPGPNSYGLHVK